MEVRGQNARCYKSHRNYLDSTRDLLSRRECNQVAFKCSFCLFWCFDKHAPTRQKPASRNYHLRASVMSFSYLRLQ